MGQTKPSTCVWITDKDGARFRNGDEVFWYHRGDTLRGTVLLIYDNGGTPWVALGTTRGAFQVPANQLTVWPNGR
jgi:hypothetical protein